MTHEARTAELKVMTAKALRPIAKDLGITGASRMTKDALINEIVGAETMNEIGRAPFGPGTLATAIELDDRRTIARAFGNVPAGVVLSWDEINTLFRAAMIERERIVDEQAATQNERDHAAALDVNAKLTQIARLEAHPSQEARVVAYEIRDELLADGFTEQAVADVPAPKLDKHSHWAMSYPLAPGGDGNVMQGHADYCATWGHATQTDVSRDGTRTVAGHCPRCGDLLQQPEVIDGDAAFQRGQERHAAEKADAERDRVANESAAEVFAEIAAENAQTPARPKLTAGDRFRIAPADGVWSIVELIELDPEGDPGFAWRVKVVDDAVGLDRLPALSRELTLTEDFLSNDYVTPVVVEQPKAEEVYVRVLPGGRREVVVIEEERAGNVWYRFVQKGLPRSARYCLKAHRFAERYVRVPS